MTDKILGHYIDPTTKEMRQPVLVDPDDVPPGVVTAKCPDGFFKPTWDETKGAWFDNGSAPAEYLATEYQRKRAAEFPSRDDLLIALWEMVVENRPESAQALQKIREQVKVKYPKPGTV